jgi:hypothetical protein
LLNGERRAGYTEGRESSSRSFGAKECSVRNRRANRFAGVNIFFTSIWRLRASAARGFDEVARQLQLNAAVIRKYTSREEMSNRRQLTKDTLGG